MSHMASSQFSNCGNKSVFKISDSYLINCNFRYEELSTSPISFCLKSRQTHSQSWSQFYSLTKIHSTHSFNYFCLSETKLTVQSNIIALGSVRTMIFPKHNSQQLPISQLQKSNIIFSRKQPRSFPNVRF